MAEIKRSNNKREDHIVMKVRSCVLRNVFWPRRCTHSRDKYTLTVLIMGASIWIVAFCSRKTLNNNDHNALYMNFGYNNL